MLFCPTSLMAVVLSSSWTHLVKLGLVIHQSCLSSCLRFLYLAWFGQEAGSCYPMDLQCPDSLGLGVLFFFPNYITVASEKKMKFSDNPEKSSGCSYPQLRCSTVPVSQAVQLILTLWGCPSSLLSFLVLLWPTSHLQLHAFACPLVSHLPTVCL